MRHQVETAVIFLFIGLFLGMASVIGAYRSRVVQVSPVIRDRTIEVLEDENRDLRKWLQHQEKPLLNECSEIRILATTGRVEMELQCTNGKDWRTVAYVSPPMSNTKPPRWTPK